MTGSVTGGVKPQAVTVTQQAAPPPRVHLFGGLGMRPFGIQTDPGLPNFMERAKAMLPGLVLHGPYRDYDTGQVPVEADKLPAGDIVFYVGTSLSANDGFIVTGRAKRKFNGVFLFQASDYGPGSSAPDNVQFAHLIYSYLPVPLPGLGMYIPGAGSMRVVQKAGYDASYPVAPRTYVQSNINLPHPGDYDLASQKMFISDMQSIVKAGG